MDLLSHDTPEWQSRLRVAFGLDGVFADVEKALRTLAGQVFDVPLSRLSRDQQRLLWRVVHASENFWEQLDEIEPGTLAELATLARSREWEVIFLVRRIETSGATAQVQSQRWLEAKGFAHPAVWVIDRPIPLVTKALDLDVVIDSPFDSLIEQADDSVLARDERHGVKRPVASLGSVEECLQRLCDLEHRPTPPRWFERKTPRPAAPRVA